MNSWKDHPDTCDCPNCFPGPADPAPVARPSGSRWRNAAAAVWFAVAELLWWMGTKAAAVRAAEAGARCLARGGRK